MPPVPPPQSSGHTGPTTLQKLMMGAMTGGAVGLCVGVIFGGVAVLQHGGGQAGILRTWGKYIAVSTSSFAFFLSIGTVIRTEGRQNGKYIAWHQRSLKPVVVTERSMDKWRDFYRTNRPERK